MNLKSNVLIFSVFRKDRSNAMNEAFHANTLKELKALGLPVVELEGKYNGSEETSILVQGFENRVIVERLCTEFSQECYLESHNDRASFLVYPNGSKVGIGTLTPVSKEVAEASGSYSYNRVAQQHFITR